MRVRTDGSKMLHGGVESFNYLDTDINKIKYKTNRMEQDKALFSLSIDPLTKAHLNDTARWARFLSIAGMVMIGLGLLISILTLTVWQDRFFRYTVNGQESQNLSAAMRMGYLFFMLVVLLVAFVPLMYLLQFSNRLRVALSANDQDDLNLAFMNLKKYFRYLGIVLIVVLAFYAIVFGITFLFAGNRQ